MRHHQTAVGQSQRAPRDARIRKLRARGVETPDELTARVQLEELRAAKTGHNEPLTHDDDVAQIIVEVQGAHDVATLGIDAEERAVAAGDLQNVGAVDD